MDNAAELAIWRSLFPPGDRVYRQSDGTWWKRSTDIEEPVLELTDPPEGWVEAIAYEGKMATLEMLVDDLRSEAEEGKAIAKEKVLELAKIVEAAKLAKLERKAIRDQKIADKLAKANLLVVKRREKAAPKKAAPKWKPELLGKPVPKKSKLPVKVKVASKKLTKKKSKYPW